MPALLIGFNEITRLAGNEPQAAAIDRAFRAPIPANMGAWIGPPRITRDGLYSGPMANRGLYTRAVGLFEIPANVASAQQQIVTAVRATVLAALLRETGSEDWTQRPLTAFEPSGNGTRAWWASGQAARDARSRDYGVVTARQQLAPERADGPNAEGQGATVVDAGGAAVQETAQQAANAAARGAIDYGPYLALAALGVVGFVWAKSQAQRAARRAFASNPAPAVWAVAEPGTKYPCKSKQLGRRTRDGGEVIACLTPLAPTPAQRRKGQTKPKREGAFEVRYSGGATQKLSQSRVRELTRKPRGALVAPMQIAPGFARHQLSLLDEPGYMPDAPGLPFPARAGSSPCLPDAEVWGDLRELVAEREGILADSLGREPTQREVALALEGDPAYRRALDTERVCLRQWDALDTRKAGKTGATSTHREAAQKRARAVAQGVDTGSADYVDTLAESTRKKLAKRHESAQAATVRAMHPRPARSTRARSHRSNPFDCACKK